jgi:hypothetical protein
MPESRRFGAVKAELARIRQKVQFGACAIVASRDALFGMMRMFEVLAENYFCTTRVFRTIDEAEAWLLCNNQVSTLRIDLLLERRFQCSDSLDSAREGTSIAFGNRLLSQ